MIPALTLPTRAHALLTIPFFGEGALLFLVFRGKLHFLVIS
jgi:hypothetical protein